MCRGSGRCLRRRKSFKPALSVLHGVWLLAELVHEFSPRLSGLPRGDGHRDTVRAAFGGQPLRIRRCLSGCRVLRPIPPLAWVPASIIFWPTQELSIAFVTFLGAFFTIVINVVAAHVRSTRAIFRLRVRWGRAGWICFGESFCRVLCRRSSSDARSAWASMGGGRGRRDDFGRRKSDRKAMAAALDFSSGNRTSAAPMNRLSLA